MTGVNFASEITLKKHRTVSKEHGLISLVEYLKEDDLSILRHGNSMAPQDFPVHRALTLDDKQCSWLRDRGVIVIGDFVRIKAHVSNGSFPRSLKKGNRLNKLLPKMVPLGAITIHRGMCWRRESHFAELFRELVQVLGLRYKQDR